MKILIQNIIPPFELCADKVNLLVVENNRCFYKLLLELFLKLYGEKVFIVSNLLPLVDESELQLFFKTVVDHDMRLLLIDNIDFSSDLINKIVVDRDFCVI